MKYRIVELGEAYHVHGPRFTRDGWYNFRIDRRFLVFWIAASYCTSEAAARLRVEDLKQPKKRNKTIAVIE